LSTYQTSELAEAAGSDLSYMLLECQLFIDQHSQITDRQTDTDSDRRRDWQTDVLREHIRLASCDKFCNTVFSTPFQPNILLPSIDVRHAWN